MMRMERPLRQGKRRGSPPDSAFTLIELLIVVGIISILASIATPNFLEAQTRAKVSRVLNDARVIATALESYCVDNGRYPYRNQPRAVGGQLWPLPLGRCDTKSKDLCVLTTPISYISTVPIDVFDKKSERPNHVLDYWSREITESILKFKTAVLLHATQTNPGYAVLSVGPDGSLGYFGNVQGCPSVSGSDPTANTIYKTYDPTNGTVSLGNVFRLQSGGEASSFFNEN